MVWWTRSSDSVLICFEFGCKALKSIGIGAKLMDVAWCRYMFEFYKTWGVGRFLHTKAPTHGLVQYHLDTFISAIQVMLGKNEKLSSSWLVEYTTEGMPIVHELSSSIRLFSPIAPWHLQYCATSNLNIMPSAGPKKMYKTIEPEALIQFDHLWSPISINFVYLVLNHCF